MTLLLYFSIFYSFVLLLFIVGLLSRSGDFQSSTTIRSGDVPIANPQKKYISIIVACKNEENNIKQLIDSLSTQTYDKEYYEVIIADDGSTDGTANLAQSELGAGNIQYFLVNPALYPDTVGKKKAIAQAIDISKGQILAFTDADCIPSKDWLQDINNAFKVCDFYTGYSPLIMESNNIINTLKNIERASIFAISAGSTYWGMPLTCTARNMAYLKELWDKVNGFDRVCHLLSGDDDLMLHKLNRHIKRPYFSFNNDAIVPSVDSQNKQKQINQETRRASKFIYYPFYIQLLVLLVAVFYCLLTYHLIASLVGLTFLMDLIIALITKVLIEFTLLFIFLKRFNRLVYMKRFILAELLYIPYFLYFGLKGTFGKYTWKS